VNAGIQTTPGSFDLLSMDRQIQRRVVRGHAVHVAAWSGLIALGFKKGGVLGWLGAGAGVYGLVRELLAWRDERPEWRKLAPRKPLLERLLRRGHSDPVDQASAASFPASDAPTYERN
jgi:hypothetical protein